MFTHKTPNPPGGGGKNVLIFSAVHDISRTFICWPPKIPTATPWGGKVDFLGSKTFPDLSECACIYKQNITDVAKQLKRVHGFVNKI